MLADERMEGGSDESHKGRVADIVAEKADIGSGRTYSRLHKVMLAAGEGLEIENGV